VPWPGARTTTTADNNEQLVSYSGDILFPCTSHARRAAVTLATLASARLGRFDDCRYLDMLGHREQIERPQRTQCPT